MKNSKGYNRKVDRFYKDIMNYVDENVLWEDGEERKAFLHAMKDVLKDIKPERYI
tara:strand:+ start:264 stop:428 length:165 start_codon:yes stop_codon:yes gene_type:complete